MRHLAILLLLAGCTEPARPDLAMAPPALPVQPAAIPAEAAATRPSRLPWTFSEPVTLVPRGGQAGAELAPLANRDIEAPPIDVGDPLAASLEPMLLPQERLFGMTFGREHLRETGPDRPFDSVVPGARLVIPFEPTPPR